MQTMCRSVELYEAANVDHQSSFSINRLIGNIGAEESRELLVEALPVIVKRKETIISALEQQDLETACVCAHKAAGSIRLYGSSRLEALLLEVMALTAGQSPRPGLDHELAAEFDSAIHEIEERLRLDLS